MPSLLKHVACGVLLWLCLSYATAQTNITRVEYYIDTDPGYGNGTEAAISPSPELSTFFRLLCQQVLCYPACISLAYAAGMQWYLEL